jgi:hypothetical protein
MSHLWIRNYSRLLNDTYPYKTRLAHLKFANILIKRFSSLISATRLQAQDPLVLFEEEAHVSTALNDNLAEEELKWKQRAKVS